ncbi:MAG: hypothetical protein HQL69_10070 [Magnetococcales bacterium]|nr:hypothetical protein [Magnetococcales bacterium]
MLEKYLIFLTKDRLTLFYWKKGGIAGPPTQFTPDEEGHNKFAEVMSVRPEVPVTMLVDLIEEEYRTETIPHVFGPDRVALHQRRSSRAFPASPYNYLEIQGREKKKGRRDDIAMLCGITDPDIISGWLNILAEKKVSLAGVYSLPLLSMKLLKPLDGISPATLMVSWQSTSGLRFSFFSGNHLKMSRMAPVPEPEPKLYSELFVSELAKTREYLGSLRLVPRDTPLQVVLFTNPEMLDAVRPKCIESATLKFRLMTVNVVARKIGIKRRIMTPFSDSLFVQLLGNRAFGNHYAPPASRGFYFTRLIKSTLLVATVIISLVGLGMGGSSFYDGWVSRQKWQQDEKIADALYQRYKDVVAQHVPTAIDPGDVRKTVLLVKQLEKRKTTPNDLMLLISKELEKFPLLRLDDFIWQGPESDEAAAILQKSQPKQPRGGFFARRRSRGNQLASADKYFEIGTITGNVTGINGDIELAVNTVNTFMQAMLRNKQVHEITPLIMPAEEEKTAVLQGDVFAATKKKKVNSAPFSFKIIVKGGSRGTSH